MRSLGFALALLVALAGCDGSSGSVRVPPEALPIDVPPGYVVFHFKMHGDASGIQDFRAATNDLQTIGLARRQLDLPEHARNLHVDGHISRGNGGHNLEWTWHFVPGEWRLAEVSITLCDGNAVLVEQAVEYWTEELKRFCPVGSYVARQIGTLSESTDGLIVKYLTDLTDIELQQAIARAQDVAGGLGIEASYLRAGALGTHVFKLDDKYPVEDVAELAVALEAADSMVEYAEPDRVVQAAAPVGTSGG